MRAWEIDPSLLKSPIIDIGSGKGPLKVPGYTVVEYDLIHGDPDATFMATYADQSFATVYSNHCLEHIEFPVIALRNWWRILKRGGYLIVVVPHRRLYEKRQTLPSRFNPDHKHFWLPDEFDPPVTFSLLGVARKSIPYGDGDLISLRVIRDGYVELPPEVQSPDGFHIELVMRKL